MGLTISNWGDVRVISCASNEHTRWACGLDMIVAIRKPLLVLSPVLSIFSDLLLSESQFRLETRILFRNEFWTPINSNCIELIPGWFTRKLFDFFKPSTWRHTHLWVELLERFKYLQIISTTLLPCNEANVQQLHCTLFSYCLCKTWQHELSQ